MLAFYSPYSAVHRKEIISTVIKHSLPFHYTEATVMAH